MTGKLYHLDHNLFMYFLIAFFILCSSNSYGDNMIIDDLNNSNNINENQDFCENSSTRWCFVTDKVMGGVSEGKLTLENDNNEKYYKMIGDISTLNNGGFIQFRTKIKNHPSKTLYDGIRIKVRGNNETYAIHIRTKYLFLPWQYYQINFNATKAWKVIELPFEKFEKSNFYQPSVISSIDIKTIGIVAIGREFKADIDLAFIELYKTNQ